ncbi:iron reductase [Mycobacterium sp. ITM-2016-00318]|uniref:iron reductase n=1 Tax=Mycobacterium sp. ITM-2016-00318 TaxID=2099693 RepID=UPI00287FD118|nr:iron reductase [Mycobacterium sp. ITM-2016-00318]WNG90737.1 iron reductase [Mycobacterium sp. ITM-2016-00318]
MTIVADDPLIAGMAIARELPLHESSRRLRELYPECPRVYGVAVMSDLTRRRWWPLKEALSTDRLAGMFSMGALEMDSPVAAAQQLAATLAHVVIGRVIPLLVLEGRAWDTGMENLWVHVDSEGVIDWVGVVDPTLRALPDDVFFRAREEQRGGSAREEQVGPSAREERTAAFARDGMVRLPSEAALTTWVAHRSHRALQPLFGKIHDVSGGAISMASMWHIVGAAVVGAATHVPLLAGSSELTSMRRGQAVLDALVSFGLPVRGGSRLGQGKGLLN